MAKKKVENEAPFVPMEEQPYQVPENWCWTYIGEICSFIGGGTPSKNNPLFWNGNIPWASIKDIKGDFLFSTIDSITDDGVNNSSTNICEVGDLILATRIEPGKVILAGISAAINQDLKIVKSQFDSKFLKYAFSSLNSEFLSRSSGSTVQGITITNVQNIAIPLAPLPEQQRIVDRIESLFAKLDEAKEKAQEALESFGTRKKSIMHSAFTGELTCQWRKLHGISDEWRVLTLNDVAEYKKGPFGSSITKAMFVPKGENTYKVYEQGNAIRKTLNYGHYYITESKYAELKGFAVNPGDIIISCAGTIGEIYKLPENCEAGVINQALMRVRLYPCITDNYFIYYFSANIRADVEDKANGTAIKNIPPFKVMKAMGIMLPSVQEQTEIVRILDNFFIKEAEAEEKVRATLETIDSMKKSILSKAFRGELGTNNPEDESAEELLKRTLA